MWVLNEPASIVELLFGFLMSIKFSSHSNHIVFHIYYCKSSVKLVSLTLMESTEAAAIGSEAANSTVKECFADH